MQSFQNNIRVNLVCPRNVLKTSTEINAITIQICKSNKMHCLKTKLVYSACAYFMDKKDLHFGDGYCPSQK